MIGLGNDKWSVCFHSQQDAITNIVSNDTNDRASSKLQGYNIHWVINTFGFSYAPVKAVSSETGVHHNKPDALDLMILLLGDNITYSIFHAPSIILFHCTCSTNKQFSCGLQSIEWIIHPTSHIRYWNNRVASKTGETASGIRFANSSAKGAALIKWGMMET